MNYMNTSKNPQKNDPPYRRVRIVPPYEEKAWGTLFDAGVPFDHVAKHEYIITSGQCHLLSSKKIPYEQLE